MDQQNRPEPDVVVVRADAAEDLTQTRFPVSAVLLAIEVMSAESVSRDRETKPMKYARAEIPHYWRVENERGRAVDPRIRAGAATGAYTSVGIFRDRMKVEAPFPMDLDLTGSSPPGHSRVATARTRTTARHPRDGRAAAAVSVGVSGRRRPPGPPGPGSTAGRRPGPP